MINNLNAKIYIAGHKGMVGSATWKVARRTLAVSLTLFLKKKRKNLTRS